MPITTLYRLLSGAALSCTLMLVTLMVLAARPAHVQAEVHAATTGADIDLGLLPDYLERAALNSPELEAAFNRWKAALERADAAGSLPDPRFNFAWFIRSVETRVGPQRARLGLAQTFPWLGKLSLKEDQAAAEAEALKAGYDAVKWRLFAEVKDAYYEYAYLAQAVRVTRENLELTRYLERVTTERYAAGASPFAAVVETQVRLSRLEDRLRSLEDLRHPLMARLNALMNQPAETELPWPGAVPMMCMDVTRDDLARMLRESSPELEAMDHAVAGRERAVDLARREYYPDVTLGLESILTGDIDAPNPPSDSGKDAVAASMSINVPLWLGRRAAGVREAENRRLAAIKDRSARANRLAAELETALYRYRDATRQVELYRATLLPQAEQVLNVTLEAFQNGQRTAADLMAAETTLLEFELNSLRALSEQARQLAVMERLIGREIPCRLYAGPETGERTLPQ